MTATETYLGLTLGKVCTETPGMALAHEYQRCGVEPAMTTFGEIFGDLGDTPLKSGSGGWLFLHVKLDPGGRGYVLIWPATASYCRCPGAECTALPQDWSLGQGGRAVT